MLHVTGFRCTKLVKASGTSDSCHNRARRPGGRRIAGDGLARLQPAGPPDRRRRSTRCCAPPSALAMSPTRWHGRSRPGASGNIALILPDVTNPFFSALMRGAQSAARERGYATFLGDSDETDELENLLLEQACGAGRWLRPRLSPARRGTVIRRHAARRPLVIVNRDLDGISRVLVDTTAASPGPSITSPISAIAESPMSARRRLPGRTASACARSRPRPPSAGSASATSTPSGRAMPPAALRSGAVLESGATAALAVDDVVAQGMIGGLADRGLSVPSDFSLVGCDDVIAETTHPPLTTVTAHCARAGAAAVDLLLDAQAGASATPSRLVLDRRAHRARLDRAARSRHRRASHIRARTPPPAGLRHDRHQALRDQVGDRRGCRRLRRRSIADAIAAQGRGDDRRRHRRQPVRDAGAVSFSTTRSTGRASPPSISTNISPCRDTHPASFRRYLKERFTSRLPTLGAFHFIDGDAPDLDREIARINAVLDAHPIDVMFAGIGENGHLAFNDPPADFDSTRRLQGRRARGALPPPAIRRGLVRDPRRCADRGDLDDGAAHPVEPHRDPHRPRRAQGRGRARGSRRAGDQHVARLDPPAAPRLPRSFSMPPPRAGSSRSRQRRGHDHLAVARRSCPTTTREWRTAMSIVNWRRGLLAAGAAILALTARHGRDGRARDDQRHRRRGRPSGVAAGAREIQGGAPRACRRLRLHPGDRARARRQAQGAAGCRAGRHRLRPHRQ